MRNRNIFYSNPHAQLIKYPSSIEISFVLHWNTTYIFFFFFFFVLILFIFLHLPRIHSWLGPFSNANEYICTCITIVFISRCDDARTRVYQEKRHISFATTSQVFFIARFCRAVNVHTFCNYMSLVIYIHI